MSQSRIITFTTDFGVTDPFVGTMHGVILSINPNAKIVDISHGVQSFDILDGAITIAQAYRYFPADTIHVVVVDPGVGSSRRPILAVTEKHVFIAPDNGVLSLVFEREERLSVRHITSEHYFLQPLSNTFHGRDIFSAVAGWMSKGVEPAKFGDEITDFARFSLPKPKIVDARTLKGVVLKVDKFGNLITNITAEDVPQLFAAAGPFKITVGAAEATSVKTAYAEGATGEVFGIVGSMGYLEIAANRAVAAQLAKAGKGSEVQIVFEQPQFASPAAP
ncbi:MAG TPA: SAM-dependent chlorinase/fluorinase [Clostridia bacterium]|nr:SAM-dependent chlorinase/fluorinase [Clostridia bacterium]